MADPTTTRRRTAYRRALTLALTGVIGLATPALASGELDDIRDRLDRVGEQQGRIDTEVGLARADAT